MANITRTCGLLLFAGLAIVACEDLPKLEADVCGNGVIEKGEDCDGIGIGESTCNALCRLACTAERACPTGFGCGSDDLCRQPTGAFEPFGPALGLSAERLSLADFDGDGQADLLASRGSSFSVAYVGPQGLLPETTSISYAPIDTYSDVPAVLDIDGDGRADLASRLGPAVGVLRGQQNRTLLPLPFARTIPGLLDDDVLFLADTDRVDSPGPELYAVRPDGLYLLFARKEGIGPLPKKVYSYSHGGALPHVTVANEGYLLLSSGRVLVLAWDGDTEITSYAPFVTVPDPVTMKQAVVLNVDAAQQPVVSIALASGAKVNGAVLAGRISAQNQEADDLVIPVTQGGEDKLLVTFYQFNGYSSVPPEYAGVPDNLARKLVRYVDGKVTTKRPLAMGYLASDNLSDFVDPDGIHLHTCQLDPIVCYVSFDPTNFTDDTPVYTAYSTAAGPETAAGWTSALVIGTGDLLGDLTGTAYGQVITTSAQPGFTFFKRAAGNALNPFRVQTQSAVLHPRAGDFNGDGSPDLVFSQISTRATAANPDLESLHVAFGDPFGVPRTLADLGDVGKVQSIFAARIVDALTNAGVSGLSDAMVRSQGKAGSEYYLFAGSTDGALQSALSLAGQCTGPKAPKGIPRFLTLARGAPGAPARLVSLFRQESGPAKYDYHLWSTGLAADGSVDVCKSLIGPFDVTAASGGDVAMVAVDLNGDGADETLILPKGGTAAGVLYVAHEGTAEWKVDKIALDAPARGIAPVDLGRTSAAGAKLVDIAVVTDAGVTVLWNDGTGTLDAAKATAIPIAGIEYTTKKGIKWKATRPLGVTAVGASPKGTRSLAIVTEEDTFVVELADGTGLKFGAPARQSPAFGGGGEAVTAGDINGDGVDDLVIARPGGIQIFSGIPVVQ